MKCVPPVYHRGRKALLSLRGGWYVLSAVFSYNLLVMARMQKA